MNTELKRRASIQHVLSKKHRLYLHHKPIYEDIKKFADSVFEGNLLDVGCGNKPYSFLFHNNIKYVGLDLDESNEDADIYGSIYNIPLGNESFDNIVSFQVLEHLNEPLLALIEIFRVLKKDGKVFMTIPQCWETHEAPYDFFRYTEYGLKYLFEKAGFHIIDIKKQGCFISNFALRINRLLNRRYIRILFPLVNYVAEKLEKNSDNDVVNYSILAAKR